MAFPGIGISSGGNTAGTTGTVFGTYVFQGGNNITLSQITGSLGTHTMVISGGAGGGGTTFNSTVLGAQRPYAAQSSTSLGQNSVYIWPENFDIAISAICVKFPVMVTNSSSAASSGQKGQTIDFAIYSRNSTNSTVLTRHYSTSYTIAASYSSNVSWMLSIATAVGASNSYNTTAVNSAGLNLSASLHGAREVIMPISSLLSAGEYWMALRNSTSGAGTTGAVLSLSNLVATFQTQNRIGVSINASNAGIQQNIGWGTYSATTGALPAGISMTQINQSGMAPLGYIVSNLT